MAYFPDCSEYSYGDELVSFKTINVGWLSNDHDFDKAELGEEDLDRLWRLCKISIAQTRGVHICDLCSNKSAHRAERNGEKLLLGTSEIRLFSVGKAIVYAAPTLIYHYVYHHKYKPPDNFMSDLRNSVLPPTREYFEQLKNAGLKWNETSSPTGHLYRFGTVLGDIDLG